MRQLIAVHSWHEWLRGPRDQELNAFCDKGFLEEEEGEGERRRRRRGEEEEEEEWGEGEKRTREMRGRRRGGNLHSI